MFKRFQLHLEASQLAGLRTRSKHDKVPVAILIRRAVDEFMEGPLGLKSARRAKPNARPTKAGIGLKFPKKKSKGRK